MLKIFKFLKNIVCIVKLVIKIKEREFKMNINNVKSNIKHYCDSKHGGNLKLINRK